MLSSFTGSNEGLEIFNNSITKLINNLSEQERSNNIFKFVPEQKNEGFKAPIDVQYVALTGNFKKAGLPYTGALNVFENAVRTDYLWTKVRVLGGAYGCMCGFGYDGSTYFVSYRDPNLQNTLDVYKGIIDYLKNFDASEEEMLKYIIGAVGTFDFPKSPANKGYRALNAYLCNRTVADYQYEKAQLINTTKNDIKGLVAYVEAIVLQNNLCVIGNEKKIEEAKVLFKEAKPLFK